MDPIDDNAAGETASYYPVAAETGFDSAHWSDIVPIPQDDGPAPVAPIEYDPDCKPRQMLCY
jgi:hypothetical protein